MAFAFSLVLSLGVAVQDDDPMAALVDVLKATDDASFQLDVLKGIRDGLKGRPSVKMPAGWPEVRERLAKSPDAEVRQLAQQLSITFGDVGALDALRASLADTRTPLAARKTALDALLSARDPKLPAVLDELLGEAPLRGAALRALAGYERAETPSRILELYPKLDVEEKRDAINTLVSRKIYAQALVRAVQDKKLPRTDLTAASIRQLRELGDPSLDKWIADEWGSARSSPEAKLKEIDGWKKFLLSQPKGDPRQGRAIYAKTCQQCHTLFDAGGKVGPELTGANRSDIDYVLQNILDPSAVIGKDYQALTIRLKNERVLTGLVKSEDRNALTLITENDTLVIPVSEIDARRLSEISMMPEGLLANLTKDEARHLVAYLMSPVQVPLPEGYTELFNGKDLAGWEGDAAVWSVEDGEIVGRGALKRNSFLFHVAELSDFRLVFEVKLKDDKGNSGVQFRSVPEKGGEAKGCQADIGPGWWGKLYEESARGQLFPRKGVDFDASAFVKKGEWNTYEILAVGAKIRTAINGHPCTVLDDEQVARKGRLALQVHSGGMMEVRFRKFDLEIDPKPELKTVK
jgi:putative heme-binding domain-containing protein